MSWRDPGAEQVDPSLEAQRVFGVMVAIDTVRAIHGDTKIHATRCCLGDTLLRIAAAAMAMTGWVIRKTLGNSPTVP